MNDQWITTAAAAKILGLDQSSVRRLIRSGLLPHRKITDRLNMVRRADVRKVAANRPLVGNPNFSRSKS